MLKILKITALAAAAACTLAGPAQAFSVGMKDVSFTTGSNVLSDPPALVFVPKNGKYEVQKDLVTQHGGYNAELRLKAKRKWPYKITKWEIFDYSNKKTIADSGFSDTNLKTLNKTVMYNLGWAELKKYVPEGQKLCKSFGHPEKKKILESKGTRYFFTAKVWAKAKGLDTGVKNDLLFINVKIVCMPVPFEVKDVDLTVKHHGSNAKCPAKVTLNARFHTNKKEKHPIKFQLVRGDGAKQWNTTHSGSSGMAFFNKTYTFTKSETRKYMIIVQGSPVSTKWVPMKVNCGEGIGGFNTGPKPSTD